MAAQQKGTVLKGTEISLGVSRPRCEGESDLSAASAVADQSPGRDATSLTPEVVLISAQGVLQPLKRARTDILVSEDDKAEESHEAMEEILRRIRSLETLFTDGSWECPSEVSRTFREGMGDLRKQVDFWGGIWKERDDLAETYERRQEVLLSKARKYKRRMLECLEELKEVRAENEGLRGRTGSREDAVCVDDSTQTDPPPKDDGRGRTRTARSGLECSTQTDPSGKDVGLEERVSRLESLISRGGGLSPSVEDTPRRRELVDGPEEEVAPPAVRGSWSEVVRRRSKRKEKETCPSGDKTPEPARGRRGSGRVRATAEAVVITCRDERYEATMRRVRSSVRPEELGIGELRQRRTVTGALLFEVEGPDGRKKADILARKVREAVPDKEVVVTRPRMVEEVKVTRIVDSVSVDEIVSSMARKAECSPEEISPVGGIARARNGLGMLWVRLPREAARTVCEGGFVQLGDSWTRVAVALLGRKPLQCYKCLELGHVAVHCRSEVNRSDRCYRCGEVGHRARGCVASPKCPLCLDRGEPHGHRLGGWGCSAAPPANTGTGGRPRPPRPPTRSQGGRVDEGGRGASPGPGTSGLPPKEAGGPVTTPGREARSQPMEVEGSLYSTPRG